MKKHANIKQSNFNYWSKRTARQYAYYKTMGIDPDETARIEKIHKDFYNREEYKGMGLIELIEITADSDLERFPTVPTKKLFEYVKYKEEFDIKYLR